MIHATICGVLTEDAFYADARRSRDVSRQAIARFTISMRRGGTEQRIACRLRGTRATSIEAHLVEGKRVVVSGELRLPKGDGLAHLHVDVCELVGGTPTYNVHDDEEEN